MNTSQLGTNKPATARSFLVMAACLTLTACTSTRAQTTKEVAKPTKPPICAVESPELCVQDGVDLYFGIGGREVDREQAKSKFELACMGNHQRGCTYLGMILKDSDDELDTSRGLDLLDEACEKNVPMACAQFGATLFERAWVKQESTGKPATKTFERANARLAKACETPLPEDSVEFWGFNARGYACGNLAAAYEHGFAVDKNLERALRLNRKSCEMGWQRSCAQIAYFLEEGLGTEPAPRKAAEIYESACKNDDAMACANLAAMLVRGQEVAPDEERARELYARACKQGYPGSCEARRELDR